MSVNARRDACPAPYDALVIRYESAVSIDRSPTTVFRYLSDPGLQGLWSDVPMRRLTDGPFAAGSRMEVTFAGGPLKAVVGLELTALEPGRRLAFASFSGPLRWSGAYELAPEGSGGTRVSQAGTLAFTGLWRAIEPVVGAEIKRGEIKELERLKAAVESHEPAE
jgi:uncharacterized protein YndB with AHSA1/START domain